MLFWCTDDVVMDADLSFYGCSRYCLLVCIVRHCYIISLTSITLMSWSMNITRQVLCVLIITPYCGTS